MTKNEIERLLPEITQPSVKELVKANILLANLAPRTHKEMVVIVLNKLSAYYRYQFFDKLDPKAERTHLPTWMGGLADITTRNLFGGLIKCLKGETEYVDKPPQNVIALKVVCKNSSFPSEYFEECYKNVNKIEESDESKKNKLRSEHPPGYWRNHLTKIIEEARNRQVL